MEAKHGTRPDATASVAAEAAAQARVLCATGTDTGGGAGDASVGASTEAVRGSAIAPAGVPSSATGIATPAGAGLPCRPEVVPEPPAYDVISQRGGGSMGGGRGRGRGGGYRGGNYRASFSHGRGGYDNAASSSSSYAFLQPRQPCGNRQETGWDSAPDIQQPLGAQQQQPKRAGRGRGGYLYGQQQSVVRRPYRGSGRSRGSWPRPRRFGYDEQQQQQQLLQQDVQSIGTLIEGAEQSTSYTGQVAAADVDVDTTTTVPQHQIVTTLAQQDEAAHLAAESVASIESITLPTSVLEPRSPKANDAMPTCFSMTRPDQPLSIVTETPVDSSAPSAAAVEEQHIETIVSPASNTTSPTRPIHWQDLPFHGLTSLVHPSHAPEMVYAWYPFAVLPGGEGRAAQLSPPPPPPPAALMHHHHQQPPPGAPPPHFYFTHDHAFLALCHPVPLMPVPWFPIPYLRYWGPERLGAHPNLYDVPMFASDV